MTHGRRFSRALSKIKGELSEAQSPLICRSDLLRIIPS